MPRKSDISSMTETSVRIDQLRKSFGGPTPAIDGLSLDIAKGEFLVLLGPSGCGKTTTLRCLSGLESADEGRITLRDEVVFDAAARIDRPGDKRDIGMVFQSYALWPHLTVRKNLEFPLRARKLKKGIAEGWVDRIADIVECGHLLDRYPAQLSGGQQQRVALARGLVSRPDLVPFDEPLSNLDARLRKSVRAEIHLLHRDLGFTAVYVTHDQDEAFALGDRLAIMRDGRIEQLDTPQDVYRRPASEYVAEFIGMSNRLAIRTGRTPTLEGQPIHGSGFESLPPDTDMVLRVRPEDVHVATANSEVDGVDLSVDAIHVDTAFAGRHRDLVVKVGGVTLQAFVPVDSNDHWLDALTPGDRLRVGFKLGSSALFDQSGKPLQAMRTVSAKQPEVIAG